MLKTPNKRVDNSRFIKNFFIVFTALVIALVLIFSTIYCTSIKPKSFDVKFYDDDVLIEKVTLKDDEVITSEILKEINSSINTYDDLYHIEWSYRKNELVPVDFNKLYTHTSVYLFLIKNEYTVEVVDNDLYEYEIIHDGPIKYGNDVVVDINPLVDLSKYYMEVSINGNVVENTNDYKYIINNIKEDVIVDVCFKEIIEIIPNLKSKLVYNNRSLFVTYSLFNKEANIIDTPDIVVTYVDEDGNVLDSMFNAGTYRVKIEYVGDIYYVESPCEFDVTVEKAIPTLDIINNNYYYNGVVQNVDVSNFISNSDGEITVTNNEFMLPGSYKVTASVSESLNYHGLTKEFDILVNKGKIDKVDIPNNLIGYEYSYLNSINFDGFKANVDGTFSWVNNYEMLKVGKHNYKANFIPNDPNYETFVFDVLIDTLSIEETLRRIKIDRSNLYNEFKDILDGYVYGISNLPVSGDTYNSNIIWLSDNTSFSVDKLGYINLVEKDLESNVTLTAYITLGNTAEYATFEFIVYYANLYVDLANNTEKITLDSINTNLDNLEENDNDHIILDIVISSSPSEIIVYQNIEFNIDHSNYKKYVLEEISMLQKEQTINYVYKSRCNKKRMISEIILWKIISDSAGANDGSYNICNSINNDFKLLKYINDTKYSANIDIGINKLVEKQKIYNTFMKGEK